MPIKEKLTILTLAVLAYLLPLSTRTILREYSVFGTDTINDFTRVFLFGIDIAVLAAVVILARALTNEKTVEKRAQIGLNIFILWTAISLLAAAAQTWLATALIIRLVLAAFLFSLVSKIPSRVSFVTLSIGIILAGVVQSIIALAQFGLQSSIGLSLFGESPLIVGQAGVATFTAFGQKFLRAYGTLPHPNILAAFLMIACLWALALFLIIKHKSLKITLLACAAIIFLGLILTFSRLFLILMPLAASALLIVYHHKSWKKYFAASVILVFLLAIAVLELRPVEQDASRHLRQLYNQAYAQQTSQNPWTGVGPGQSVLTSNDFIRPLLANFLKQGKLPKEAGGQAINYQDWIHQPVHSTYLVLRSETGWVGMTLFLLFLVFVTDEIVKILKGNLSARQNIYFLFSAVAAITIIAAMFFEHMFITNPNILYLSFIIFAMLVKAKSEQTTVQ